MTEPKPFCWSFPQGKIILLPMVLTTVSFALSIAVNMTCEFVSVTVVGALSASGGSSGGSSGGYSTPPPSYGGGSYDDGGWCRALSKWSPEDVPLELVHFFAEKTNFDERSLQSISSDPPSHDGGWCRALSKWSPEYVPLELAHFFAEEKTNFDERSLQSVSSDLKLNGGLWSFSYEDYKEICIPYAQGVSNLEEVGMPSIDAPFKVARAGGILASIAGFGLVVALWMNSCVPHSTATQFTTFFMFILAFVFQGLTCLVFVSESCDKVTLDPPQENVSFNINCAPSVGLYCAVVSAVFFLAAAVSVVTIPRKSNRAPRGRPAGQQAGVHVLSQQQPPPVAAHGQSQVDPSNSVLRQAHPDGSTVVISRQVSPEGNVVVTKETTFPDGMKKVERTIEHSADSSSDRPPSEQQQQQLRQDLKQPYQQSQESYGDEGPYDNEMDPYDSDERA